MIYGHSSYLAKQKYRGMFETQKVRRTWQVQEIMVSTLEQMQVPNGTEPGVWMIKRPLLASRIRYNVIWKPTEIW